MLSCAENPDAPQPFAEVRTVSEAPKPIVAGLEPADRFGIQTQAQAQAPPGGDVYYWDVPEGWTEEPPTAFRTANLRVAGNPDAECTLTVLPSGGGGLLQNVNRWRGQMGLEPLDDAGFAALPRHPFLHGEAVLVDVEGAYAGMGGGPGIPGYRLVGLAALDGAMGVFVKMTGPANLIEAELDAFYAFCASIEHTSHLEEPAP